MIVIIVGLDPGPFGAMKAPHGLYPWNNPTLGVRNIRIRVSSMPVAAASGNSFLALRS